MFRFKRSSDKVPGRSLDLPRLTTVSHDSLTVPKFHDLECQDQILLGNLCPKVLRQDIQKDQKSQLRLPDHRHSGQSGRLAFRDQHVVFLSDRQKIHLDQVTRDDLQNFRHAPELLPWTLTSLRDFECARLSVFSGR